MIWVRCQFLSNARLLVLTLHYPEPLVVMINCIKFTIDTAIIYKIFAYLWAIYIFVRALFFIPFSINFVIKHDNLFYWKFSSSLNGLFANQEIISVSFTIFRFFSKIICLQFAFYSLWIKSTSFFLNLLQLFHQIFAMLQFLRKVRNFY